MSTSRRLLQVLSSIVILSMLFSGFSVPAASAQEGDGIERQVNAQTGKLSFLGPESGRILSASKALGISRFARPDDPGMALAERFGPEFGLKNPARDLKEMKTNRLDNGRMSVRYQQTYQGIPVMGGELIVNTNGYGDLYSMNGEISPDLSLSTQPTVGPEQARQAALEGTARWYRQSPENFVASEPELWIFDESLLQPSTRPAELVWRMEVTPKEPGMPVRELVLVNAQRGNISLHFNQVDTAWGGMRKEKALPASNTIQDNVASNTDDTTTNYPTRYIALQTGTTWYVATTGNDTNDCQTPATPCATINAAIGKAGAGETVKTAIGTYIGTGTTEWVVSINKNVTLSGGWNANFTAQSGWSIIDGQGLRGGVIVQDSIVIIERVTIQKGRSAYGAGIFQTGGTLTLNSSTISNNKGRGINTNNGTLIVNNSTVSGSTSGGITNYGTATVTLNNSTVSGNTTPSPQGGGIYRGGGPVTLKNTIVAGNFAMSSTPADCYGTIDSAGYNLIGNTSGCTFTAGTGDLTNVDPQLGTFIGYYPLQADSPAVNAGNPAAPGSGGNACLASDERGVTRPVGEYCDIGAYEYAAPGSVVSLLILGSDGQHIVPGQASSTPLKVAALDNQGSPVPGVEVTFTAPASGASALFTSTGTNTSAAIADANGIATSSTFSANSTAGGYVIQATVDGLSGSADFQMMNGSEVKTYTANGVSSLPGTFLCNQSSFNCTNGNNVHADSAQLHAMGTYSLYMNKHDRNGIDNNNMTINSTVEYCSPYSGCPYNNAYWSGTQVVYGAAYGYPLADDVVAHELTHGVTQYESGLFYYYQSGAIDESFSDLWGEYYDQSNGLGMDTTSVKWLVGEDVLGKDASRSMSNPPAYNDPDKMTSSYYYKAATDSGGVHHNSGINNKAVYLMVEGGTFNGKTVTALGWEKTAAIYYEANSNLLISGSDYSDLYYALQQACSNLIGQKGITPADCDEAKAAIDAVEMNVQPEPDFNTDAPYCDIGDPVATIFSDDLESGTGNWTFTTGSYLRWQYDSPYGPYAHSGNHFLYADDDPDTIADATARLVSVTIPNNGYLHFAQAYGFDQGYYEGDPTLYYFDGGVLEYSINGGSNWADAGSLIDYNGYKGSIITGTGNPLAGRSAFVGESHGYIDTRLNLASLAGQNVIFRWRMGLDEEYYAGGWWVDDVKIYRCLNDIVPPAAISDLSSTTGTLGGTVTLNWTAPGDDGNTGTASSYLVRYSTSAIVDEATWNAATLVTTGIPAPKAAGLAEIMTVSGLLPGQIYYFAVRAQDDGPSLGPVSNSPSAVAQIPAPLPVGSHDDTNVNWAYVGAWTAYNGSGPLNNTSHYTNAVGASVDFRFTGTKFIVMYAKYSSYGLIDVFVDGTKITTIDTYNPTSVWRATWASPYFDLGTHSVRLIHAGAAGKYIELDAVQILDTPPPAPVGVGTYEDTDPNWTYSTGWTQYNGAGPSSNNSHYTPTVGSSAELTFTGAKFTLTYAKHSSYGLIDVYVDGAKLTTVNSYSATMVWRATYTSPVLTMGTHTLRLVHAGAAGKYIDLDAIQIFGPPDSVAPAAIGDLVAATGTTTGSVDLTWTAPGDDGDTGTATSYLVRYSTSAINDTTWATATPVTTGIPTPGAPTSAETMTVSGLVPGVAYHFAVRAQDEEPNLGGMSNAASAAAQVPPPVPAGNYDDNNSNWLYSGTWTAYNGSGPLNNTSHYTGVVGSAVDLRFTGTKFILTYAKYSSYGLIDVYVDGVKIDTIDTSNPTTAWRATWASPYFILGNHTVRLVHAGPVGKYIELDNIQILDTPPPAPVGVGTYEDTDPNWTYSTGWTQYNGTGPSSNNSHYTPTVGSSAELTFTGAKFTLTYAKHSSYGLIDVYVDGAKLTTINSYSATMVWRATYTSPVLTMGTHTLRLVHAGAAGKYIDIDAIQIYGPPDAVPPAAIDDLVATTGTTTGSVDLTWTAPGDDGDTGTTTSYLVRYSTSAIDASNWASATPVTSGIPVPLAPTSPQSMTVTGLVPGVAYHFAVRAQDEEPNLGGMSNAASAAAKSPTPVPVGTYEDIDSNWIYTGAWTTYSGTGPSGNNSHYTRTVGDSAQLTFTGTKFILTYAKHSSYGLIDVYVDGVKIDTINSYASTMVWRATWTSPNYPEGTHIVRFVHAGAASKFIDLDAIQILNVPPPPPVGKGTYDDTDSNWTYSSGWTAYTASGPLNNTSHYTGTIGSYAELRFTGVNFILTYAKYSSYGSIDVFVDGTKVGAIDTSSPTMVWRATWSPSSSFTDGTHTLRLVHAGPAGKYIDIDAIQILAAPDTAPPADITDLAATTGTINGTVKLDWTAVGDDDLTGTAASYLVRYSTSAIDDTNWATATPVTTGIPAPLPPTSAQSMTVTGLVPGVTYHFAVRAQDEEPNLGGMSNAASAAAKSPTPVPAGTYDDVNSNWTYTGIWTAYTASGPLNNTGHYTRTVGDAAELTFTGTKFILTYAKHPSYGLIDVYVDGVKINTINSYSSTMVWRATYTSPNYAAGTHTVRLVHAGAANKFIDLDSIEILNVPPPPPVGAGTYDDTDSNWTYSSGWTAYTGTGPLNNTGHYTSTVGSSAELRFTGTSFTLTYARYSNYGWIDVYVDGVKIATIDTYASTMIWRATWSPGTSLTAGDHTLRLVHAGDGTYIDIDAITILP